MNPLNPLLRSRLLSLVLVALCLIAFLQVTARYNSPQIEEDSPGYLAFAQQILTGELTTALAPEQVTTIRAVRTPGYPLLLALTEALVGGDIGRVLLLHLALGASALVAIPWLLRGWVWPPLTALATLFCFLDFRNHFPKVMTEWSSLVMLLAVGALIVVVAHRRNLGAVCTLAGFTAAAILVRPALVVLLPLGVILSFLVSKSRGVALYSAVAGAPLLLWSLINLHAIGVFGLTAFDGYNLFGVAALVGHTEPLPTDPPEQQRFFQYINGSKTPTAGNEDVSQYLDAPGLRSTQYNAAIYDVALKFPDASAVGAVRMNEMMKEYATRVLSNDPVGWLQYIWGGATFVLGREWVLALACCIALLAVRLPATAPMGWGTAFLLGVHLMHLGLCLTVQAIGPRYLMLTLVPLYWMTTLTAIALVTKLRVTLNDQVSR